MLFFLLCSFSPPCSSVCLWPYVLILFLGFCSGKHQSVGQQWRALVRGIPTAGQPGLSRRDFWIHGHSESRGQQRSRVPGFHTRALERTWSRHFGARMNSQRGEMYTRTSFFISLPASGFLAGWEAVVLTHLGSFEVIGLVLRTSPFPGLTGYCF